MRIYIQPAARSCMHGYFKETLTEQPAPRSSTRFIWSTWCDMPIVTFTIELQICNCIGCSCIYLVCGGRKRKCYNPCVCYYMVTVVRVQCAVISKLIINIYISQALKQPMQLKYKQDEHELQIYSTGSTEFVHWHQCSTH